MGSPKAGQPAIALLSLEAIYHCQTHTVASLLPLFKQEHTLHLDISPKQRVSFITRAHFKLHVCCCKGKLKFLRVALLSNVISL